MQSGARIAVISPVVPTDAINVEATLRALRDPNADIENFFLETGPTSIKTATVYSGCLPGLLAMGKRVASAGRQALVINCMCNPRLRGLRTRIRVAGFEPTETSMHTIAAAGGRFSVLDDVSEGQEMVQMQLATYGVRAKYVSHHAIDLPVLELLTELARTLAALERTALAALNDGADRLLLGCMGLADMGRLLRVALGARGRYPSVVEPLHTSVRAARTFQAREPCLCAGAATG